MVRITILGPGGHTARPELTVNLLAVLGRVLTEVPERVAELAAPAELSVVFGSTRGRCAQRHPDQGDGHRHGAHP